ncbi:P-type ATPase, partial [Roseateles sp. GG27B]
MLQLLLAAGAIYLLLGDRGEALMLLAFVLVTVVISVSQEQRTEHVLEALRDLTSPRALVLRDGQPLRVAGAAVVVGDLLLLDEGCRVAADGRLLEANDLALDESLLSGESMPAAKQVQAGEITTETHQVFAGTMVVGGQGLARVTATGPRGDRPHRQIAGRDQAAADTAAPADAPLGADFSVLGLSLSAVVVLLYGFSRGDWLAGLLAGITLAMSMLPRSC